MVDFYEIVGQNPNLDKHGSIEINDEHSAGDNPLWLLILRWFGVATLIAIVGFLAMPLLLQVLPTAQAIIVAIGVILIYLGMAFFLRPEPNTDNMGWLGGFANDPSQYSDNINRELWNLHCLLGPGRFIATTVLDTFAYFGLITDDGMGEQEA